MRRAYLSFINAGFKNTSCDIGTHINYDQFCKLYPISHFNFTEWDRDIYQNRSSFDLTGSYTLKNTPSSEYKFVCVIESEREARIQMIDYRVLVTSNKN